MGLGIEFRNRAIVAMQGFSSSFKSTKVGITLVVDMSVSAFLRGGRLIDVMAYLLKMDSATLIELYSRG